MLVVGLLIAYELAGGPGVAALAVARMIPATIVTLVTDVARLGRLEQILRRVHLAETVVAAGVALALAAGQPLFALAGIVAIAGIGALVRPTQLALFPALATRPDQLLSANVAMSLGEGLGSFAGPLVAGLVVAAAGPAAGAVVAGALTALSTVALVRVSVAEAARMPAASGAGGLPFVHGIRALAGRGPAAAVVGSFGLQVLVRGALTTLLVLLALEVITAGEEGVGMLNAVIGIGGLVGAIVALGLGAGTRLAPTFSLALAGWGIPLVVLGLAPSLATAVVGLAIVGLANALLDVTGFTLLQRALPVAARPAVFALFESMVGIAVAAGGVLAPVLAAILGVPGAIALAGATLPIAAVLGWRLVRRLDDEDVVPRRTAALLRGVPLFESLPLDALERLASAMRPVRFAPGTPLMTEGEQGSRYLVIDTGAAVVRRAGVDIGNAGPGEGVGEIALLRQVPRTATVVATEPIEAWELLGDAFLAAVAGHGGASAAAGALVDERLGADAERDAGAGTSGGPGLP